MLHLKFIPHSTTSENILHLPLTFKPSIMKKNLVALFAFLTIGVASSFANEGPNVDPRILSAFQKEFSFAKDARWEMKDGFAQVRFSLNDNGFVAWYNANAELVSTARCILYMQLPLSVIRSLEKNYSNANLSGIIEVTRDNETFYQLQAEKKNKKVLLKASPDGNVTVIKRIK